MYGRFFITPHFTPHTPNSFSLTTPEESLQYVHIMTPELLKKVIDLVRKNGDKMVLADPETGKAVVVMDLEQYESLCAGIKKGEKKETKKAKEVENKAKISKKQEISRPADLQGAIKGLSDLTQEELLDKINRDIGEWKTAQELKRAEELQSAVENLPPLAAEVLLEEEERFFLEPIE